MTIMKYLFFGAAALVAIEPACAQQLTMKPLLEARIRYENVDQQGIAADAEAITLRGRAGAQVSAGAWSVLAEGQGTLAIQDDYFDGLHSAAARPLVADPQTVSLYRAQLQYKSKTLAMTGGRQRITLDDERFVGAIAFRQNGQTFDAVRMEWSGVPGLKADVAYAWNVRTIWGADGVGARPRSVDGDNIFASLRAETPLGAFTGFAYLVDQDEAAVQGYRLSSQTYGGRIAGSRKLSGSAKLGYTLSYARQADYRNNPNDYRADYWLADVTLDVKALKLNAGYEVLGASSDALTSFQTPLATGFKFGGWADKFLTTPPDGLRDLYVGAGYGWAKAGINLQASWHRFESDRLNRHYGDELNLLASVKVNKTIISARFAHYEADTFATDTQKVWLQADWTF
jgi:hypothetical protein